MSNVIKYQSPSATQTAVDTFDSDNFYPFDGGLDGELSDIEFSDASGNFKNKLKGALGKVSGAVQKRQSGQSQRLSNRADKQSGRISRKNERGVARTARKNARQMSKTKAIEENPPLNRALNNLEVKNPELTVPLDKNKIGEASPKEEKTLDDAALIATELVSTPNEPAPEVVIDDKTGAVTVKKNGWKGLSKGAKIGIIAGSALTLGLIVFAIVKSTKK
jgi:hypothetical protein